MADPAANDSTLEGLHEDLLRRLIDGFLGGRDAARLAVVSKLLKDAVMASKWPPWLPEPHILADGKVCEPLSGRYNAVVRPGEGWARLRQVITNAPEGATVLMMPGVYEAMETIELARPVYIFGNGATMHSISRASVFSCTAARGALIGVVIEAHLESDGGIIRIPSGEFRLQSCAFTVIQDGTSDRCCGVLAAGSAARPMLVDCTMRGGAAGCAFFDGALGSILTCDFCESMMGVLIQGRGERGNLIIEGNAINCAKWGVAVHPDVDASFRLGPGNNITAGEQAIYDYRTPH